MIIAILDDYTDTARTTPAFKWLDGHDVRVWTDLAPDTETLASRLQDVEALIIIRERMRIDEDLLSRLPRLKMISHVGNYPNVDVEACTRRGIIFCDGHDNPPRYPAGFSPTAEMTWTLILAAMRRLPANISSMHEGGWQHSVGRTVFGKTLGIYGFAAIGARVAEIARVFGMDVQVWGRGGSQERAAGAGFRVAESREAFFATSDIVTLHMRLVPETQGLVTSADLALMKPEAILINTSRGPLIEEGALEAALKAGRPGMAAIDVYDHEPVGANHPLLMLDNAICTPHLGYATQEQLEAMFATLIGSVVDYANGQPSSVVNTEVLEER